MMAPIAEFVREWENELQRDIEEHLERFELGRLNCNNHNGSSGDCDSVQRDRLKVEYEAALTDPRRI